jgi:O-acetyl-ADP-ribose deacetylase (regulator of RNase III)
MSTIKVIKGDITQLEVDAIVNAANSSLLGGGGVDGAIHRAGGPDILKQCIEIRNRQGGCPTGEAVITTGGNLPAKYVIHTVGPVWHGGKNNEKNLLEQCYINSLALAIQHQINSIAFPNISTGVYHFPKELAASLAIQAVRNFLASHLVPSEIIFACFDEENVIIYRRLLSH